MYLMSITLDVDAHETACSGLKATATEEPVVRNGSIAVSSRGIGRKWSSGRLVELQGWKGFLGGITFGSRRCTTRKKNNSTAQMSRTVEYIVHTQLARAIRIPKMK